LHDKTNSLKQQFQVSEFQIECYLANYELEPYESENK